jgi:hypothetical protein
LSSRSHKNKVFEVKQKSKTTPICSTIFLPKFQATAPQSNLKILIFSKFIKITTLRYFTLFYALFEKITTTKQQHRRIVYALDA